MPCTGQNKYSEPRRTANAGAGGGKGINHVQKRGSWLALKAGAAQQEENVG